MGAVIDDRAFHRLAEVQKRAADDPALSVVAGGTCRRPRGLVRPADDPHARPTRLHDVLTTEFFGPLLSVYVYDDADFDAVVTPGGRRRAVRADRLDHLAGPGRDRRRRCTVLRNSAGNFYINDKPTGAVVGQQPFGGARASGTNDKAGSYLNLVRWVSPRVIKETFDPPTDYRYPYMG